MDELLAFFEGTEGPLTYLAIGGSALIEYVFPPFPGDMATLVAVVLAASADYHWWLVYLSLTLGSVVGGTMVWGFGLWLQKNESRWPAFLRGERTTRNLNKLRARFDKSGGWYLAANRFIPAFRALFFVAAGLSGMSLRSVVGFGALSAAAWNGVLMIVGFSVGSNLERLERLYQRYTTAVLWAMAGLAVCAALVWAVRRWRAKRAAE